MSVSLKYAVVEQERRYLVASLPEGVTSTRDILDRYLTGTRLRMRETRDSDGTVIRKLGHKVRLTEGPAEVACTNFYLDDQEWAVLLALPARVLRKKRHLVDRDGVVVAVDEHEDGTLVAEIDDADQAPGIVPEWLDVVEDVTDDEAWTGARLARPPSVRRAGAEEDSSPRAVLVNGTVGAGKTSAADAMGALLTRAGVPHAVIDMDSLRQCWPTPPGDVFNAELALRNLSALATNFVAAGATHVVLAGVVEDRLGRSAHQRALGMPLHVCRLQVDPAVVRDRLVHRHANDEEASAWHLHRSVELDAILRAACVDDHTVESTHLTVEGTARAVLRAVGWDVPD